jgi:hypothetical protein
MNTHQRVRIYFQHLGGVKGVWKAIFPLAPCRTGRGERRGEGRREERGGEEREEEVRRGGKNRE